MPALRRQMERRQQERKPWRSCRACQAVRRKVNGIAGVLEDFHQHAVGFGQHFHDDLVGFDIDDHQLITLDCLARLLVPGHLCRRQLIPGR